jgi:hypothetical protein
VWEGWEAGFMAFHAFHTLSFPWPAFRAAGAGETDVPPPSAIYHTRSEMLIGISSLVIECIGDSPLIETTSQVIQLSDLPILRPHELILYWQ